MMNSSRVRLVAQRTLTHTKYPVTVCGPSLAQDPDFWTKHRQNRYRNLVDRLKLPHPNTCIAHGKEYGPLPFRLDSEPLAYSAEGISPEQLRYFATLLSCEGCFFINGNDRTKCSFRVRVCSPHDRADILISLSRSFGGSVSTHFPQTGNWSPSVIWNLNGSGAVKLVETLSSVSSPRQQAFQFLREFPVGKDSSLVALEFRNRWKLLPRYSDDNQNWISTPEHLAAAFDSFGTFRVVHPKQVCVRFQHSRKDFVLSISSFLQSIGLSSAEVFSSDSGRGYVRYVLQLHGVDDIRQLCRLVLPWVQKQRHEAQIVLKAVGGTYEELQDLRQKLFQLRGDAQNIHRLDSDGRQLSYQILLASNKFNRGNSDALREVERLKKQRDSHKLALKTQVLRNRARGMLNQGGVFMPPPQPTVTGTRSFCSRPSPCNINHEKESLFAKRRRSRYRQLVNSLSLPHPNIFISDGVEYGPLPYQLDDVPEMLTEEGIRPERLRELGGFFDGNGCVAITKGTVGYNINISVGSSYDKAERCLDFLKAFGGKIYCLSGHRGMSNAAIRWQVTPDTVHQTAKLLASVVSARQPELELIASSWPKYYVRDTFARSRVFQENKSYCKNRNFRDADMFRSKEQFGGFMDARLIVFGRASRSPGSIRLTVCSQDFNVCLSIQSFLNREGLPCGSVTGCGALNRFNWNVSADNVQTFLLYLKPYFVKQRKIMDLAMSVSQENSTEVCAQMAQSSGNISGLLRLDEHGIQLSRSLTKLRKSVAANPQKQATVAPRIQHLVAERDLHKLHVANSRLRNQILRLLSRKNEITQSIS